MQQKMYQTPILELLRITQDCLTASGEGVSTDVEWIDKDKLFS
jgi:hypothetical protein